MSPAGRARTLSILHVASGAQWRGRQRQALALAAGQAAKGHRVGLAAAPGSQLWLGATRAARPGLEVLPLRPGWLRERGDLRRILSAGSWDAAHLHDPAALTTLSRAESGRRRVPCALTVGGEIGYSGRVLPRGAPIERVDLFLAESEWVWSALVRAGIAEERIAVVPSGIDLERFQPLAAESPGLRQEARSGLGLRPDDFVVGTVLHLAKQQGVEVLLEAARLIRSGLAPSGEARIRLLVVGDGPDRAALARAAGRMAMDDVAVFAGAREDVPALMAAMDVYAHPAVSGDGFPMALREAMAMSLPVVAADLMGIREIIDNGKHGLIVPAGDAEGLALNIMRMRRDPDYARLLGKGGSLKVQRYGLRAAIDRAEEVYFRLVR